MNGTDFWDANVQAYQHASRNKRVQALVATGVSIDEAELRVPPINRESSEARRERLSKLYQYEDSAEQMRRLSGGK